MAVLILAMPPGYVAFEWFVRPDWNPLRRSPETIAGSLLDQTPRGSNRAEVQAWVDLQGWPRGGKSFELGTKPPMERILGEYDSFGFTMLVFAKWVFDEFDQLTAIEVVKWVSDAP